ncbi:hypothetical protein GIB67_014208 [Kingdonia uniflora]|uniref:Uncharacterized protein n=1 Tax=Kingdonia uniflora TaxID=39325 RepID=A0A7J7M1V7_9MAGN|nr:hypothetical protein GIB67_014208 [Kingdonia uniflora]
MPHTGPGQTKEVDHLSTISQRKGNIDMFGPTALRAGITPVVVTSASVHSLSQDFSLPSEPEEPDPGWQMEWTGRREILSTYCLRDPPPISVSYSARELWHLTHEPTSEGGGREVQVVPLPLGDGTRSRQGTRGSDLRTRRACTSYRGSGTGDDPPRVSSSYSFIDDPPRVSSSSSDDLMFDCAVAIYILRQNAADLIVHDTTSSHG